MTIGAVFLFAIASLMIIFIGIAGFGISELARAALRTGVAPGIRRKISREQSPHEFSRVVTQCFILGNVLLVMSATGAIAAGLMLYRTAQ